MSVPSSVLINSIPKSGTYFLTQLIDVLGAYPTLDKLHFNDQHYSTGEDEDGALIVVGTPCPQSLPALPAGHCAPAHLTWSQALEDALLQRNIAMFFMYRDPRDIVISYARFAFYSEIYRQQTPGHKQYFEFLSTLENDQRRTEHVLRHRLFLFQFFENAPWLFSSACVPIAFEKLYADVRALQDGQVGDTINAVLRRLGMEKLPLPPQELYSRVFGKGKTAMGREASNHASFFDAALHDASQASAFRAVMHMYGYT